MPGKETLRRLEEFGYDYLYVGLGKYRVWERGAHTRQYLDASGIDNLIQKWERKRERDASGIDNLIQKWERKRERALRKKDKQEKKDETKDKATPKRRRTSRRLRRDKSQGKS